MQPEARHRRLFCRGGRSGQAAGGQVAGGRHAYEGAWRFGSLTEITRLMAFCGALTESIVVGIGYPVGKTQAETTQKIWGLRGRDYTPVTSWR